jgi:hypothetical protein
MIRPDTLYGLTISKSLSAYELLATPTDDRRAGLGRWYFDSAEDMTSQLYRLDMSAIDYVGVDQRLRAASTVPVGHPIKGSLLLGVLGVDGTVRVIAAAERNS